MLVYQRLFPIFGNWNPIAFFFFDKSDLCSQEDSTAIRCYMAADTYVIWKCLLGKPMGKPTVLGYFRCHQMPPFWETQPATSELNIHDGI